MQLWDIPSEKLKAPDVSMKDFQSVQQVSHSTVSEEELNEYAKWTEQFGQEGA